jgi:beta-lactamase regulating signal transducer with metallopeptidase domain
MSHSFPLLHAAVEWILTSSLKGAILIAILTVLRRALAPQTTSVWRHALWLPVFACLLCPLGPRVSLALPLLSDTVPQPMVPHLSASGERTPSGASELSDLLGNTFSQVGSARPRPSGTESPTPLSSAHTKPAELLFFAAIAAWATGASLLATLYLRALIKFRRLRSASTPLTGIAAVICEDCKNELRLRRAVQLLESAAIASPTVVGWWRPTILLPAQWATQLRACQLRYILLHELAHVKRNDILVIWCASVAQLLHWFNPAVWFAVRFMRADMEAASDAHVLRILKGSERSEYGMTLLQLADACSPPTASPYALGIADRHGDLKMRLITIARFGSASVPTKMIGALALGSFAAIALIQPHPSTASASQTDTISAEDLSRHQRLSYEQSRPQIPVNIDPATFDKYAGYYRFTDLSMSARVYRDYDRYYIELKGQGPVELFPKSATDFFATTVPSQISFVYQSRAAGLVVHQGGALLKASRVSKVTYEAAAARLDRRIAAKTPSPGTQAALQAQLEGWENGRPDFAGMGTDLASASHEQSAQTRAMIEYKGKLQNLKFAAVTPTGWDVYIATFSNGSMACLIAPLSSAGKVTGLLYLP